MSLILNTSGTGREPNNVINCKLDPETSSVVWSSLPNLPVRSFYLFEFLSRSLLFYTVYMSVIFKLHQ